MANNANIRKKRLEQTIIKSFNLGNDTNVLSLMKTRVGTILEEKCNDLKEQSHSESRKILFSWINEAHDIIDAIDEYKDLIIDEDLNDMIAENAPLPATKT